MRKLHYRHPGRIIRTLGDRVVDSTGDGARGRPPRPRCLLRGRRSSRTTRSSRACRWWSVAAPTAGASWRRRATRRGRFGIRSAMSAAEARRRCPEAVFVRPSMARYSEWSRRDLDAGQRPRAARAAGRHRRGLPRSDGRRRRRAGEAERFLRDLQELIRAETGLDASFGCATSKVVAKIASDHRKPRGVTVVAARAARRPSWRRCRCARCRASARSRTSGCRRRGLSSIGDLAALDDDRLARLAARRGRRRAARPGPRHRPAAGGAAAGRALSVSVEETFERDVVTRRGAAARSPCGWRTRWPSASSARPGAPPP